MKMKKIFKFIALLLLLVTSIVSYATWPTIDKNFMRANLEIMQRASKAPHSIAIGGKMYEISNVQLFGFDSLSEIIEQKGCEFYEQIEISNGVRYQYAGDEDDLVCTMMFYLRKV